MTLFILFQGWFALLKLVNIRPRRLMRKAGAILFAAGVLLGGAKGHAYTQVEVTSGAVIRGTVKWVGPILAAPDFDVNVDENFCAPTGKIRNDR
ncbi:MAG: hypothetical protein K1X53_12485, partial [Candidatus Sumerlaeaceae bacterium]|nr:hypothetical protein [Candidatus Sumerlaeaceae bacterium]